MRANITQPTLVDLHFCKAGIDLGQAFGRQPARPVGDRGEYARSTPVGANVRAYDATAVRLRGGSRPGLSKWMSTRPWGGGRWVVQDLAVVVTAGDSAPGGGAVQSSNSGRVVTVVAVQQGNVYTAVPGATAWTAATNASGESPPLNATGVMFSASNGGKVYWADGINWVLYDPATNTVDRWESSVPGVPLPVDSDNNTPRLIETWRGRTLVSGIIGLPQAVYASAVDDPTDFNTEPAVTDLSTRAWALTVGAQGQVGDMVTGMCPYTDDTLVIGTDHELHVVRGDPAAGGVRDVISTSVGMAWGRAWCIDPEGRVWFMSNRTGVYTLVPGQMPRHVSFGISSLLEQINTGENAVRLAWDDRGRAVHVFVTPLVAAGEATHYVFETKTGAWWTMTFKDAMHNPLCTVAVDGNRPDDRRTLLGCWDGYVRQLDPDATDDDGEDIESEVLIGPVLTAQMDGLRFDQLQAVLGEGSGPVTCEFLVGNTPEAALAADPVPVGVLRAGRSLTFPVRRFGHAAYVRLRSTARWSMEAVRLRVGPTGKVARRGR